jgi:DNA-directed RNA polymerase subunit M/transcription elongation factor TFIIS
LGITKIVSLQGKQVVVGRELSRNREGKCLFVFGRKDLLIARNIKQTYHSPPMESVDQQWRELKESYALMTEDELSVIAKDAYDLTQIAREALQREISERRLNIQINTEPPPPVVGPPEEPEMAQCDWVYSLDEAKQAKEILTTAGIPSYFGPLCIEAPEGFKGDFERGLELKVRDGDQRRAWAALYSEEEKEFAILCPKCHSDAVVFKNCEITGSGSPLDTKYNWSCDACGHQWKDEGIEEEVPAGQVHEEEDEGSSADRDSGESDPHPD